MPVPNTIKYSTATQSEALRKGNFHLGVTDRDYGPSNITGFYNGSTSSNYTTYIWEGDQIRYNIANSDAELVSFLSSKSGVSFNGITPSLTWAVTQSSVIVLNRNYENIVTDGLILNLDAGFVSSYPRGGTACYDISDRNNNGVLINGVSYVSNVGGVFRLDGTNDRIDVPKSLNGFTYNIHWDIDWTIECWMYMYQPDAAPQTYKIIYGNYNGCNFSIYPGNAAGFMIYNANNPSTIFTAFTFGPKSPSGCPDAISWNTSESSWIYSSAVGKWCHFAITSEDGTNYKIYVNGSQRGPTKTFDFKNSAGRTANNRVATSNYSWGGEFTGNSSNQVDFSAMRIYNKPLSAVEILQNYQSGLLRFLGENIITSGLIMYLDAGYSGSYTTASNTWLDISGIGNNATVDGATYSSAGGGTLVFDGINDRAVSGNFNVSYLTLNVWVYKTSATASQGICRKNVTWALSQYNGTIQVAPGTSWNFYNTGYTLPLNTWVNLTYVYAGTGVAGSQILYVNGSAFWNDSIGSGPLPTNSNQVRVGFDDNGWWWGGSIPIVQIYNRVLSAAEVLQNYNAQKSRFGL